MAIENTYIFKRSTDLEIVQQFAIDIYGWNEDFSRNYITPADPVARVQSDRLNVIRMIDDKLFDKSFALLK